VTKNPFNRPLTEDERMLLTELGAVNIADQTGCNRDEAYDVLAVYQHKGELVIDGDAEDVSLSAGAQLLVEAKRDWLAFHAAHPGNDPLKDRKWTK
jgi:hypothetical protein